MRIYWVVFIMLIFVPVFLGCGKATTPAEGAAQRATHTNSTPEPGKATTPALALQQMLALAKGGEWGMYVDRFYGEQHKFRPGHDDRDYIAQRLAERAGQIIAVLEQVSEMQPEFSEDNQRAIYDLPGERRFILYRAVDGNWTFHL